jgi:hypothetical protein
MHFIKHDEVFLKKMIINFKLKLQRGRKMNKIKKGFIILSIVTLFSGLPISYAETTNEINIFLNGNKIDFDVKPVKINNRTMVPMRKIFETLGYKINWIDNEKKVVATKNNATLSLKIDNNKADINGKQVVMDTTASIIGGRTLVPLRFIGEGSNCDVIWDGSKNSVFLESKTSDYKVCEQIKNTSITASEDWLFYSGRGTYKFKFDGSQVKKLTGSGTNTLQAIGNNLYGRLSTPDLKYNKLDLKTMIISNISNFEVGGGLIHEGWPHYDELRDYSHALYRMRLDGSENTKVVSESCFNFSIIGDDIYSWYTEGIQKINIKSQEEVDISKDFINSAGVYNNELYFSASEYIDERSPLKYKGIFKYNPKDGSTKQLSTAAANEIRVINNSIYYTVRGEDDYQRCSLHRMRIDGSFDIKLIEDIYEDISVIGNCIYFIPFGSKENELYRINSDGSGKVNIGKWFM